MFRGWQIGNGISSCTGIEISIVSDQLYRIRKVVLEREGNALNIVGKDEFTGDLSMISKARISGPVALVFTGKGTLIKKIEAVSVINSNTFSSIFPNIKIEDFYIQNFISAEFSFISMIRKTVVDQILEIFSKLEVQVYQVGAGPFNMKHVIPQLNYYGLELVFDHHHIQLMDDKSWYSYEYQPNVDDGFELKLDMEPLDKHYLLAYSTGFQLMLSDVLEPVLIAEVERIQDLDELKESVQFKKYGMLLLIGFFMVLLLNFFVSEHYRSANEELEMKYNSGLRLSTAKRNLAQDQTVLEENLRKLNWNDLPGYAYVLDQIGQTVPVKLVLKQISINSHGADQSRMKLSAQMARNKVYITGSTLNVFEVNEWIYKLKERPWVRKVQLDQFITDQSSGAQLFTIVVEL